jgi:phage shock protein PspC (stress-responsive transcriptional regulator)
MSSPRRLFRNQAAGRIAGECAGIAEYLDTDVAVVRLAWIVLSIVPGGFVGGLVAYIAAWAIMPDASVPVGVDAGARRLFRSSVDRKIAGVCGGLAGYLAPTRRWCGSSGRSGDRSGRSRAGDCGLPGRLVHHPETLRRRSLS